MVQAIIDISDQANRVLNIIKAKYGLKDKSEAINMMSTEYAKCILEPELRPEYVTKASKIHKEQSIKVRTVGDLRKRYEH